MRKKLMSGFLVLLIVSMGFQTAEAAPEPVIVAEAAILIDAPTGKILYGKDEHKRMFPASTTKVLTALVALDYLQPNEILVVGAEIHNATLDSSKAGHRVGESILVENLIRGLIMPSGSETSCVVALEVAKRATNNRELSYNNAEQIFSDLMNKKAESLGANNSNFVNPHGLHNPNHFTSAYDMALISIAAMENDVLKKIVGELSFIGNGAGENPSEELITQEYTWYTRNMLLSSPTYSYPYATGIKTGFTDEAGDSLAASAKKDEKELIVVVFNAPEPARWIDSVTLFDYGFNNFDYQIIQEADVILEQVELQNYKLGEEDALEMITNEEFGGIFSQEQVNAMQYEIIFNQDLVAQNDEIGDKVIRLKAPIAKDEQIAKVIYTLENEVIFEGDLLATRDVEERTARSDFDYYLEQFKATAFSLFRIGLNASFFDSACRRARENSHLYR